MDNKKIAIITSESIEDFPPIIALLKALDMMGYCVSVITPFRDSFIEKLSLSKVVNASISKKSVVSTPKYSGNRFKDSVCFHLERLKKRFLLKILPYKYSRIIKESDVIWVLHEMTLKFGGKALVNKLGSYLLTMYELRIENKQSSQLYEYAVRKAKHCVVTEYFRAHIVKAYYGLNYMPTIIHNLPFDHPRNRNLEITDAAIAEKIHKIRSAGKKIILYMGIISPERPLTPIIDALKGSNRYVLAVLGYRTRYLEELEKKYQGDFVYLGYVVPPEHLRIASQIDIAYISYVPQGRSINAVFCAPNKVFEFAGFGIPMLCNDNPSLKYTIEYYGMGACVPQMTKNAFSKAIAKVEEQYAEMSRNAISYYDSFNYCDEVSKAIQSYLR